MESTILHKCTKAQQFPSPNGTVVGRVLVDELRLTDDIDPVNVHTNISRTNPQDYTKGRKIELATTRTSCSMRCSLKLQLHRNANRPHSPMFYRKVDRKCHPTKSLPATQGRIQTLHPDPLSILDHRLRTTSKAAAGSPSSPMPNRQDHQLAPSIQCLHPLPNTQTSNDHAD